MVLYGYEVLTDWISSTVPLILSTSRAVPVVVTLLDFIKFAKT